MGYSKRIYFRYTFWGGGNELSSPPSFCKLYLYTCACFVLLVMLANKATVMSIVYHKRVKLTSQTFKVMTDSYVFIHLQSFPRLAKI